MRVMSGMHARWRVPCERECVHARTGAASCSASVAQLSLPLVSLDSIWSFLPAPQTCVQAWRHGTVGTLSAKAVIFEYRHVHARAVHSAVGDGRCRADVKVPWCHARCQ